MSDNMGVVVAFGGAFLTGAMIGLAAGESKYDRALQWSLTTTSECEQSYVADGYKSVTDCLESAIWAIDDEREIDPG